MDFQLRLCSLREERNMKQNELAEKLNLKASAISKYEKGLTQPSIPTLMKMAEIFECSVDYLLGLSAIKNPYSSNQFTPKESDIIFKYRKLTKENQIRIEEFSNLSVKSYKKSSNTIIIKIMYQRIFLI